MFIDIHLHAVKRPGPLREGRQFLCTGEQLLAKMDAIGIEQGVLLPIISPEAVPFICPSEDVLEIAQAHPGRFIPFCNIDPRQGRNSPDSDLGSLLRHYRKLGCKGVGEVTANLPFLHPLTRNLFKHAESEGMPLLFHAAAQVGGTYGLVDEPGLHGLARSLSDFPKLNFIGHSQVFWSEIGELKDITERSGYPLGLVSSEGAVPKLMRKHPNLYGDLSAGSGYNALARDPAHAARFLEEFQDRLLFGTDMASPQAEAPLAGFLQEMLNTGRISKQVFEKIAKLNTMRLLDLTI